MHVLLPEIFKEVIMKKYLLLIFVLLLTVSVFGAGKQEAAKKVSLNVIVRNYTLDVDSPYKTAKATLEKRHPNVTVNIEGLGYDDSRKKTLITVGANQQLDVVQLDYIWVGEYAEGKILKKLTSRVKGDKALYNDIIPQFIDSSSWNGDIYGLWVYTDVRIIGWVKKYLSAAGLDPNKPPATYQELAQNAAKAQNPPDVSGYFFPLISGESTAERWYSLLISGGGEILSKDFKKAEFNSEAGVKALQFYVDAVNKYKIVPKVAFESEEIDPLMWNQKLVYGFDVNPWPDAKKAGWSIDKYNATYGLAVPPKMKGGKVATTSGGYCLGIPRTTVDENLAWEYIKIATSPDNEIDFLVAQSRLATRKSLSKYEDRLKKSNPEYTTRIKALNYTHFPPWNPKYVKILEPIYSAIQKATLLKASPKEALDEAAQAVNKILAQ